MWAKHQTQKLTFTIYTTHVQILRGETVQPLNNKSSHVLENPLHWFSRHCKQSLKVGAEPLNIFGWAQLEKTKAFNVSEQARNTAAKHRGEEGRRQSPGRCTGPVASFHRFYYQLRLYRYGYFANRRRNLRQLLVTALLPELPPLSWTIPNPLQSNQPP